MEKTVCKDHAIENAHQTEHKALGIDARRVKCGEVVGVRARHKFHGDDSARGKRFEDPRYPYVLIVSKEISNAIRALYLTAKIKLHPKMGL